MASALGMGLTGREGVLVGVREMFPLVLGRKVG